jgi:hypothetical protein
MSDTKAKPFKITNLGPASLDGLEIHPLALAFPAYNTEDMAGLVQDIEKHGMREPVTLFEGKVLDGRNRVEAAKNMKGYFPRARFEGTFEQARDYVISLNLIRRHLDTGQRAMIAADLANITFNCFARPRWARCNFASCSDHPHET